MDSSCSLHYGNVVQTENRLKRIEGDVARIATAVGRSPYHVPECVRRLAGANLIAEEMQELETRHVAETVSQPAIFWTSK
ncbi:hypothetical protein H9Q74_001210 [Fusarium xylarioides]|nr:hypothetical protein H9Q71_001161 [Fusarium xylarioides]KAG5828735.1 hypothetical protein H9Q74_001210 [Fusarium xylarioides]